MEKLRNLQKNYDYLATDFELRYGRKRRDGQSLYLDGKEVETLDDVFEWYERLEKEDSVYIDLKKDFQYRRAILIHDKKIFDRELLKLQVVVDRIYYESDRVFCFKDLSKPRSRKKVMKKHGHQIDMMMQMLNTLLELERMDFFELYEIKQNIEKIEKGFQKTIKQ